MKTKPLVKTRLSDVLEGIVIVPIGLVMVPLAIISMMVPYSRYYEYLLHHGTERQKAKVRAKRKEADRFWLQWERDEQWRLEHEGGKH